MSNWATVLIVVGFLLVLSLSIWYANKSVTKPKKEPVTPKPRGVHTQLELDILYEINQARVDAGMPYLVFNDVASQLCQSHIDMCIRVNQVSHTDWDERSKEIQNKLPVRRLSELVASGHKSPKVLVESLLESPEHKKILIGDYNEIGISAQLVEGKMFVGLIPIKIK